MCISFSFWSIFSILKILLHVFLASIASNEKSAVYTYFCFVLFLYMCLLALAVIKVFSLSLVVSNLIMMCFDVLVFWFLVLGVCWFYWSCGFTIFFKFRTFPWLFFPLTIWDTTCTSIQFLVFFFISLWSFIFVTLTFCLYFLWKSSYYCVFLFTNISFRSI